MAQKLLPRTIHIRGQFQGLSNLQIVSAIFNGCLGLVYLCLAFWILEENLRKTHIALPLDQWLLVLFQGFIWLLVGLVVSLRGMQLSRGLLQLLSILAFLLAGIVCVLSLVTAISSQKVSVKTVLDILSLPGAILCCCAHISTYMKRGKTD